MCVGIFPLYGLTRLTHGYGEAKGFEWTVLVRMDQSHILAPVRLVLLNIAMAGAAVWVPMFIALAVDDRAIAPRMGADATRERRGPTRGGGGRTAK